MKRLILLTLPFLFFLPLASAQDVITQTLRGTIIDKESHEPLAGATIIVVNTQPLLGTVSDDEGKFRLEKVPVGRQTVKISYTGYNEVLLADIIVNSAKEVVLNIEMTENLKALEEFVVNSKANKAQTNNELVMVSGRSFTIDQTQRYAGALGDPSRMAASFAGVATGGNDQRNDIIIRGNSPLGLLWRFEGVDIPNPNHFSNQGANGGPVSILNNNVLANSDFVTGAFPAEYGNAMSGVFDLKMRNGNNEKHEFTGQIGFSGVEIMAEGPIQKGISSYLINYRYSTLAFLGAMGLTFGDAGVPNYQDLSYKFNFTKTKLGSFAVWGIGGLSSTEINDSELEKEERDELAFPQDIAFSSRMGATGVTHTLQTSKNSYLRTVVSISGEGNNTQVDSLTPVNNPFSTFTSRSRVNKTTAHSFWNKKISTRHSIKAGVIATRIHVNQTDSFYYADGGFYVREYAIDNSTGLLQGYVNWNYRITDALTFNSGLHYNQFMLNNSNAIEPRAALKWSPQPKHNFSLGYGIHGQVHPYAVYFSKTLVDTLNRRYIETNHDLKMSKSQHFILGYEWLINNDLRFKAETYYQNSWNLAVTQNPSYYSTANFGADYGFPNVDSLVNNGKGRNYGLELTLEKFFSNNYYFLITTSLYNSEYLASDNKWRNTAFAGNYIGNALFGKEWKTKKNGTFYVNLKVVYAGGRRDVPLNLAQSQLEKRAVYDEDNAYRSRYPDFFRTDLKFGFRKNGKKVTQEWAIDIQNVSNRQNVLTKQYNSRTGKQETLYQIGIFPVPFYRIYF